MTKLLKDAEVSEVTLVAKNTLADWRKKGVGPPWFKLLGSVRYREDDVQAWIEEQAAASGLVRRSS